MASCSHDDRASRTASCRRPLATRMCRTDIRTREYFSDVGQWAATGAGAHAAARSRGDSTVHATDRAAAARPAGDRAPRPPTDVAGRGSNRQTRRTLLSEVGVRSARSDSPREPRANGSSPTHYRRFAGQQACQSPLPTIPDDYDLQLRTLRRRLRLTQDELVRRIGAAGKAVVYQWESRKRTPSPVLWQRVLRLACSGARPATKPAADAMPPHERGNRHAVPLAAHL